MICSLQIDTLPVTSDEIKAETLNDHVLKRVSEFLENRIWPDKINDDIKPYYNKRNELSIKEGIILWGLRVIIPVTFRNKVLEELHRNHPGISRMKSLSRIHIWFPNIDKEIENIVKSCKNCEKISNESNKSEPHPWDWPSNPIDRIHLDYFEHNNNNFLIMVDEQG